MKSNRSTSSFFSRVLVTVVLLFAGLVVAASAADVKFYVIAKGQVYEQTNAAASALSTDTNGAYLALIQVSSSSNGSIQSVTISNQFDMGTLEGGEEGFGFQQAFATKDELDSMITNGTYTFTIVTVNDGTRRPSLTLGADQYPPAPHVANWAAAQDIDPFAAFVLRWDAFPGGSANDFVQLTLGGEDFDGDVFSTPSPFEPGVLTGQSNSVVIPAGVLEPGRTYSAQLLFANTVQLDTTSYPGANGFVAFFRQTDFQIAAVPVPAQGRIQFAATNYVVNEGDGTATVHVMRLGGSEGDVDVHIVTEDITATAGSDYTTVSIQVSFPPGVTNVDVSIPILEDDLLEGAERLRLNLVNVQGGAELGKATNAVLTIEDNEVATAGVFQFSAANYPVGESAGSVTITVTRTGGSASEASVHFATVSEGSSASNESDYAPTNATLSFGPGVTSRTFTVPITSDEIDETNEVIRLALSDPTGGASLGARSTATVTITDDDAGGTISFSAAMFTGSEGTNDNKVAVIVRRATGDADGVTVDFAVVGGTATFQQDYTNTLGTNLTLHFESGELAKTNLFTILDDQLAEGDETILLNLRNATGGAQLGPITNATVKIVDDEVTLQFSSLTYSNKENAGLAMVMVERTGPLNVAASVEIRTHGGSATPGVDYLATNATLDFPAGLGKKPFGIRLLDDQSAEDDKTVGLELRNPSTNALIGVREEATLTILDDDEGGVIQFSVTNLNVRENGAAAVLVVTRTGGLASNVTVQIETANMSALDGADYYGFSSNLVFGAREGRKTVRVLVLDDTIVEETESFRVTLSEPSGGGSLGEKRSVIVNITDNDVAGLVSFSRPEYVTNENAGAAKILVTRSGGAASDVSVRFTTADGTNSPATGGLDYTNVDTVITFGAGQISQMVMVPIIDDNLPDGNETVLLRLREPSSGARLGVSNAVLRILDDESSISLSSATYAAGESSPFVNITVVRTGSTVTTARVDFATSDIEGVSAAEAGTDYLGTNFTLIFPPGMATKVVPIRLRTDMRDETNETFEVRLTNPVGTQLGSISNAVVTINDDDTAGTIQFSSATYSVTEGVPTAAIKVFRTGGTAAGATVHFETGEGSASAGTDYTAVSTNLTFAARETMKTIFIPILTDMVNEESETVPLSLTSPGGGAVLGSTNVATLTLINRFTPPPR